MLIGLHTGTPTIGYTVRTCYAIYYFVEWNECDFHAVFYLYFPLHWGQELAPFNLLMVASGS